MTYWLLKSEPSAFSIDDLSQAPHATSMWDGVRNYQARNFIRDSMKIDDLALFYHSSCPQPGVVGLIKITSAPYPDPTQFDTKSLHYDSKSKVDNPRWYVVDVTLVKKFAEVISLETLKKIPQLQHCRLLQKGNRLSIIPLSADEWAYMGNNH